MGWSAINTFATASDNSHPSPYRVAVSGINAGDLIVISLPYVRASATLVGVVAGSDNASGAGNTYYVEANGQWDTNLGGPGLSKISAIIADTSVTQIGYSWSGGNTDANAVIVDVFRHSNGPLTAGSAPYSGTPTGSEQTSAGSGNDNVFSGNTTPGVNGCLIHGAIYSNVAITHGTNFTQNFYDTNTADMSEYLEQANAAAIQATATIAAGNSAFVLVSAYGPPPVPGGGRNFNWKLRNDAVNFTATIANNPGTANYNIKVG